MSHFAFVTYEGLPELTGDDQLAVGVLRTRGHMVTAVVWTDPAVDWTGFDLVVLRSCWDYHRKVDRFRAWLTQLQKDDVRMANPVGLAQWNVEKTYLRDLAAAGVPTVPTVWLAHGAAVTLASLRAELAAAGGASGSLVIKPAVSATAWLTWRVDAKADRLPDGFADALVRQAFLVQPLLGEIVKGEWSLVFFAGKLSHAVIKRPRAGEFRVQEEFGGQAVPVRPERDLVDRAADILAKAPGSPVYARVDGVDTASGFVLLELELLEPVLYLATHPEAPRRFADALENRVRAEPERLKD